MPDLNQATRGQVIIERTQLQKLFDVLAKKGFNKIGPTVRNGAVVLDDIKADTDLPIGWSDTQGGGTYNLKQTGSQKIFDFTVGQDSWKTFLYPPVLKYWTATKENGNIEISQASLTAPKQALIGVRACELAAIAVQDKILMSDKYGDPAYIARRNNCFIVAVNCSKATGTCFCDSMKTGPRAQSGFDLALTEVFEKDRHYFIVDIGTEAGAKIIQDIATEPANSEHEKAIDKMMFETISQINIKLDTQNLKEILWRNFEHPRWDDVTGRCLACSNCTMVCPTCFCVSVEENTDLKCKTTERIRRWDSCYRLDFSYIFGGSIRPSPKSRYRQWLTHKLASWVDQFGTFGCVGCGRCITWCPVGINIAEEATAIRNSDKESNKTITVKG
jgi:formate hydrogenlyase subunit 6/NADH:ubiquinone oxidoreductase subunit I